MAKEPDIGVALESRHSRRLVTLPLSIWLFVILCAGVQLTSGVKIREGKCDLTLQVYFSEVFFYHCLRFDLRTEQRRACECFGDSRNRICGRCDFLVLPAWGQKAEDKSSISPFMRLYYCHLVYTFINFAFVPKESSLFAGEAF